jgi:hypothetical protein
VLKCTIIFWLELGRRFRGRLVWKLFNSLHYANTQHDKIPIH